MVLACASGSVGAFFFKKSSVKLEIKIRLKTLFQMVRNKNLIAGIFFYVIGAGIITFLLQTENLSFIYPLTSMTYIFTVFLSVKLLKEKMNMYKWLAIFLIITGNIFITV